MFVPRRLPQFGDVVEYPLRDIEMQDLQDGRTAGVRTQCLTELTWDARTTGTRVLQSCACFKTCSEMHCRSTYFMGRPSFLLASLLREMVLWRLV